MLPQKQILSFKCNPYFKSAFFLGEGEQEDTKAGSFCENRATWRYSCIPQLQYLEADIEGTFAGIGGIWANCFGQSPRVFSLGYLKLHFYTDELQYCISHF